MKILSFLLILLGSISFSGCGIQAPKGGYEECPVCRFNGDLGCLYIKPKTDTPSLFYNNKQYFFCSDDCKEYFKKDPEKYLTTK